MFIVSVIITLHTSKCPSEQPSREASILKRETSSLEDVFERRACLTKKALVVISRKFSTLNKAVNSFYDVNFCLYMFMPYSTLRYEGPVAFLILRFILISDWSKYGVRQ